MKEYRKTYLPLIAWCLALVPVMLGAVWFAEWLNCNDGIMIAMMMAAVIVMLLALFWMICKGEHVYWINGGPSFEEARDAGSEARREYARKHLRAMFKGCVIALVLLAAECCIGANEMIMVLSTGVCVVWAAVSTISIKWTNK